MSDKLDELNKRAAQTLSRDLGLLFWIAAPAALTFFFAREYFAWCLPLCVIGVWHGLQTVKRITALEREYKDADQ